MHTTFGCRLIELKGNDWCSWFQAKNSTFQSRFRQLRRSEVWFAQDTEERSQKKVYMSKAWERDLKDTVSVLTWAPLPWDPYFYLWEAPRWGSWGTSCCLELASATSSYGILLLLLWVARVTPNGPNEWASALVTNNGEIPTTQAVSSTSMALTFQSSLWIYQPHLTYEGAILWEFYLSLQLPSSLPGRVFLASTLLRL